MTPAEYNKAVQKAHSEWRQKKKKTPKPERKSQTPKQKPKRANWYANYLKSEHWKSKRAEALRHHGGKCSVCGSRDDLQVHHKHYGSLKHETMNDLQILCRGCHENAHEGKPGVFDPITQEYLAHGFGKA